MSPATIGLLIFAVTFGGVLFGTLLRGLLPQHYFDKDSQDAIKLGIGLIATMTALVLGLITASTKSSFDDVDATVSKAAYELLTIDRLLARYGHEASGVRQDLQSLGSRACRCCVAADFRPARFVSACQSRRNYRSHPQSGPNQ